MVTDRDDAPPELAVFARNFREARKARDLTQAAVSVQVGVDKSLISDIERGCANPTLAVLSKLAAAVKRDLCELICVTTHAH